MLRSSWCTEGEKRSASSSTALADSARVRTRSRSLSALPSYSVSRRSFSSCGSHRYPKPYSGGLGARAHQGALAQRAALVQRQPPVVQLLRLRVTAIYPKPYSGGVCVCAHQVATK